MICISWVKHCSHKLEGLLIPNWCFIIIFYVIGSLTSLWSVARAGISRGSVRNFLLSSFLCSLPTATLGYRETKRFAQGREQNQSWVWNLAFRTGSPVQLIIFFSSSYCFEVLPFYPPSASSFSHSFPLDRSFLLLDISSTALLDDRPAVMLHPPTPTPTHNSESRHGAGFLSGLA